MCEDSRAIVSGLSMAQVQQHLNRLLLCCGGVGIISVLRLLFLHFHGYGDKVQEEQFFDRAVSLKQVGRAIGNIFGVKGQGHVDSVPASSWTDLKRGEMFRNDREKDAGYLQNLIGDLKKCRIASIEPMVGKTLGQDLSLTSGTGVATDKSTYTRHESKHHIESLQ